MLSVLTISYATSVRAYLQQQSEIRSLNGQIQRSSAEIESLAKEQERWQDPAFKEQMARQKFGFVKKGEVSFIVLDADGNAIDRYGSLDDPRTLEEEPPQWYAATWASVRAADAPPEAEDAAPPPAEELPAP